MSENGSSSAPIPNGEGASRHPGNKVTVVLGAQWGDEGKGKVVDLLAQDADIVCRCQRAGSSRFLFDASLSLPPPTPVSCGSLKCYHEAE
ncbi:UNVERIFIED_CONTAM: hypothetical protein K2H54_058277 [Gekko kuhli]